MPRRHANDDQAADIDVDAAVDALYVDEPDLFTAARDDLARRLRAAGRRDDAATVKGLRRPTVAAWAVNRVARDRADDLARLRALGEDLRRAQDAVLGGGAGGSRADADRLRELASRRRAATSALVDVAVAALAGRGMSADAHRDDIVGTFEAVTADPSAAEEVAAARLARPLQAPVGLGAPDAEIVAFTGSDDNAPRAKKPAKKSTPSTSSGRVHVLDAAEVRKARARAAKAREAEEAAAREVARLEAALTAARQEAARAKEAASRADAAARAADAAARSTG